ncbi:unnamed protein product [Phytomonas sp. Hart1]|nr:unnamed protein product [Phytomonas sp. Hart1]|eukprot:CCW67260.1 unnamed protein product [Phytomonas sp. isolate Hart1]
MATNVPIYSAAADESVGNTFFFSVSELIAGAVAGFAEHVIMFPFDTIKTRVQSGSICGISDAFCGAWKGERIWHMYRGCMPILLSALPAHASYFGAYEAFKRITGDSNVGVAMSASIATIAHDTVSTPFDVIKQRMQMDRTRNFKSSFRCCKYILKCEGLRAMYVSLPTTVLMNVPHSATYWLVYEAFFSIFNNSSCKSEEDHITFDYLAAGFLAGAGAAVVSFPMDTIKTHLQLGHGQGFSPVLRDLISKRGMRGIFAGVLPRILYTAPSGALMMVAYQTTKDILIQK